MREALAKFPPLALRDRRIADLEYQLRKSEYRRTVRIVRPSFQARVQAERRLADLRWSLGAPSTSPNKDGKFATNDIVRSLGIDVPELFGQWDEPAQIPWNDLPDLVVVKGTFGSTGRGVFPMRRVDGGWQVASHEDVISSDEIVAQLRELEGQNLITGPFGVEEFLEGDDGPGSLPTDIKAFAFYGEVPALLLVRRRELGNGRASRYRYIDPTGQDLDGLVEGKPTDFTIRPPANLEDVVEAARRLSLGFRVPFSRIDMYSVGGRVVFGEITPRPGGQEWFGTELDTRLGEIWESAQVRRDRDLAIEAAARMEADEGPEAADDRTDRLPILES